jgi:hypothetical protein
MSNALTIESHTLPGGFDEYLGSTPNGDFLYYRCGNMVYRVRVQGGEYNIYHNRNGETNFECLMQDFILHKRSWKIS